MIQFNQNEMKDHIPDILRLIRNGEEVVIVDEHNQEKIAVILPYRESPQKKERPLGILKGKASYRIHDDFKITDEEFFSL